MLLPAFSLEQPHNQLCVQGYAVHYSLRPALETAFLHLQVKGWCYYESRLLGAHHGLLSTYALETMVLYLLNHHELPSPLKVHTQSFAQVSRLKQRPSQHCTQCRFHGIFKGCKSG